jgi:hypothetical protein
MDSSRVTFLEAAERVLRQHSPGAPLHFKRIAELALADGLLSTGGKTPDATMGAQLYTDVKRRQAAGKPAKFRAVGRGLFALATPTDPLGGPIDQHNTQIRSRLRSALAEMDPQAFEHLIANLLNTLGFEDVEVTSYSGDGGIDVRAILTVGGVTDVRTAVQVKRWAKNVPGRTVRELRGGLGPHERGLIITLSDFTPDARSEAQALDRTPITLLGGDQLLALLIENEIGVAARQVQILELDEASLLATGSESPDEPETHLAIPESPTLTRYRGTKSLSMWPLPGGQHTWVQTLQSLLRFIAETAPTTQAAAQWIIDHYKTVSSDKVARGYLAGVLRPFGLIETEGEQLVLTSDGTEYLANPTSQALLSLACHNVAGFEEILEALQPGPKSSAQLLDILRAELGVTWQTDAQVRWRLLWLANLGAAEEDSGSWRLPLAALSVAQ